MINRYDDFTKIKEVVLGNVNYSLIETIPEEEDRTFFRYILEETELVLERLNNIFKQAGVKVFRPKFVEYNQSMSLGTPFKKINFVTPSLTPFDNFLAIADTIVEMSSAFPGATYDYVQYQHIWKEQFAQGSRWISMPKSSFNKFGEDPFAEISNWEPYADSPSFSPFGDTIFTAESIIINQQGYDWFHREFPQFKLKRFKGAKGHLDSIFHICKPGLILSGIPKEDLPDEFKNWEVIEFGKEEYGGVRQVSDVFQDDDYEQTTLAVNCFNLDEENLIMMKHTIDNNPSLIKTIEKHQINIIPLEYDVCRWLNQGISCFCNALNRTGKFENYF